MSLIKLRVIFVRHHVVYIKLAAFCRYVTNLGVGLLLEFDLERRHCNRSGGG